MKPAVRLGFLASLVLITGFVLPRYSFPTLDEGYRMNVSLALEPLGFLYPGARIANRSTTTDRCGDRGLEQVLVQTHSWMFIPGPLVELCVDEDDPKVIKSTGIVNE